MTVATLVSSVLCALLGGESPNPWALELEQPREARAEAVEETAGVVEPGGGADWLGDFQVHVYGNFLANRDDQRVNDPDGNQIDDRMRLREVDVDLVYDISETMRGVLMVSYESDPVAEHEADIAEAWVGFDQPFGRGDAWEIGLRAGKFRTAFGQNGRLRLFELPQPTRPLPVRYYLGDDGLTSTGIAGRLAVALGDRHVLALHGEAINSGDLPLTDAVGEQPFGSVVRTSWTWIGRQCEIDAGLSSYEGRKQPARLNGADLRLTRRSADPDGAGTLHLGGEAFEGQTEFAGVPNEEPRGYYGWGMLAVYPRVYLGLRYDHAEEVADATLVTRSWGAYVTYVISQHGRIAVGWESFRSDVPFHDDRNSVYLEVNFGLGPSPAQPFWLP